MEKKLFSFDYEFYKNTYTDLERDNIISKEDCLAHFLRFGKKLPFWVDFILRIHTCVLP